MSPDKPSQQPVHDGEEAVRNFLKGLQMPERHATAFMMQNFEVFQSVEGHCKHVGTHMACMSSNRFGYISRNVELNL